MQGQSYFTARQCVQAGFSDFHCNVLFQKLQVQIFQLRLLVYLAAACYWSQKWFSKKEILLARIKCTLHSSIPIPGEYPWFFVMCGFFPLKIIVA